MRLYRPHSVFCIALCWLLAVFAQAETLEVITTKPENAKDTRYEHAGLVLKHLLKITEKQYGPATLREANEPMSRDREFAELTKGEYLHVAAESAKSEWVKDLIPIFVPVNKGITGYRVFLISKNSQSELAKITTLEELKKIKTGAGSQWSSTPILKNAGFNVISTPKLEGLFWMLMGDRFQVFPRGINEAPNELAAHKALFPDMRIEENLAVYIPLPTFFFVSPKHPKLAERIKVGLDMMYADGSFNDIFYAYHMKMIADAKLGSRKIFPLENPTLPKEVPLKEARYWFKPGDELEHIKPGQ